MAKHVPFHITSGLPFAKQIVVTLPAGRTWWTVSTQFEVLGQIREAATADAPLLLDLYGYMTSVLTGNVITIDLVMTGTNTRELTKSGRYDIVISDAFSTDARAYTVIEGDVYRDSIVTAELAEIGFI